MDKQSSPNGLCEQVRAQLSAYLDGEMSPVERLGVESHLAACQLCSDELTALERVVGLVAENGRRTPAPPPWEQVRAHVEAATEPSRPWSRRARLALAASLGGILLVGFLALRNEGWRPVLESALQPASEAKPLTAGLPGLDSFLAERQAEEVSPADLGSRLGFHPSVPEELGGGYRLARTFVIRDRCCTGSALIYRRGDDLVTVIQQNPLHPVTWGDSVLEDVQFEGLVCRKGISRGLQILQIEPAGRNLTLVAYEGTVDLERLARELIKR